MSKALLPILMCVLVLGACAGRQEKIEAENRRPLRDIFPPPSLEQADASKQSATPAPASADVRAREPAPRVAQSSPPVAAKSQAAPGTPAPAAATAARPSAPAPAVAKSAPISPAPAASGLEEPIPGLPAPSLEDGQSGYSEERKALAEEAMGVTPGSSLAEEFGASAQGRGVEPEPAPDRIAAAEPTTAPTIPSTPRTPAPPVGAPAPRTLPDAAQAPSRESETATKQAPRIIFSTRPALLLPVYGEPRLKKVDGTALMRVENSPAILLKGKSGNFYVPVYDGFMQARSLNGPWTVVKSPPKVLKTAKAHLLEAGQQDLFASRPDPRTGRTPSLATNPPRIVVSSEPTALIVVDGQPGYQKVRGTGLSRLVNTQALVLRDDADGKIYVQIGDDWYRGESTKGPWQHVPSASLPADFAKVAMKAS
ncbi:MAG TPA: hypothetical protein VFB54_11965 [Burkholderiales bacterium]|nr:hypothetical protein [Burkholderiales bacterium]